ncbi:hypothetical protein Tco_1032071 [Tanacetum coccineum]|uniref:Uncharacterized protein n=1 Tax=Tanacetum coccineum TaxID=301880 RepID=A0ABQ5GAT0_9ASTR
MDDDQEEAEMKKYMEIVVDEEEIAVDAIPLSTKPPMIIQALVDGKKVIITKTSVRRAIQLKDAEEPITDEAANAEHVPTHSNDLIFSEITKLKERVKKLERRNKSRTPWLKRLRKVGRSTQVFSSKDKGLGAQDDAFKQGRKIADLDADVEVTLVDEAQGRNDDNLIFDTGVFYKQEVKVEKVVSTTEVTTFDATTTTVDELTLAQTLIEIKAAKLKAVTTTATTTTTTVTRPKAQGVVVQELTQLNVELEEKEKLAKQREEDANIVEWDNVQAIIDGDYELVERLQEQEQNMARFTHSQLKNKSFDEVQKAFDKTMGWIDSFVTMDSEVVKGDDDQEVAEMKKHMEIVVDEEEIVVDAIPLATKPSIIIDWKIIKEGNMGYFQLIRADGSLRRTQEKKYPLTPATIIAMLNKKLQTDHWNEMCYQLLKLMTKQGRIVGIKRLHDDLGVNTAKVRVTAAKHNLLLITTAKRISTVRRIKMKIAYQDYLRDKVILYGIHSDEWKSFQSQHQTAMRLYGGGGIPFQLKSDSLPHAHAQTTKTYYKHQDSRIKKAQELKTKTSANSDIKDNSSETKLRGRLLESFQDDAKYEHVGQDTRSQGGKDDQDKQGKDLEISKQKIKSKYNDKGSRSKIT